MGVVNNIVEVPISISDVVTALEGQANNNLFSICTSTNLNMWARFRPTAGGNQFNRKTGTSVSTSDYNSSITREMYGLQNLSLSSIPVLKPEGQSSTVGGNYRSNLQWQNILPSLNYYRLADFYKYYHEATPPFVWTCRASIGIRTMSTLCELNYNNVTNKEYILPFSYVVGNNGSGILDNFKIGLAIIDNTKYQNGYPEQSFVRCLVFPITLKDVFYLNLSGICYVSIIGTGDNVSFEITNTYVNDTAALFSYNASNLLFAIRPEVFNNTVFSGTSGYTDGHVLFVRPVLVNNQQSGFVLKSDFDNCYSFELKSGFATGTVHISASADPSNYVNIRTNVRNSLDYYSKEFVTDGSTYYNGDWYNANPNLKTTFFDNCYLQYIGIGHPNPSSPSVEYYKFKICYKGYMCIEFKAYEDSVHQGDAAYANVTRDAGGSITKRFRFGFKPYIVFKENTSIKKDIDYIEFEDNTRVWNSEQIHNHLTDGYLMRKESTYVWNYDDFIVNSGNSKQVKYCNRNFGTDSADFLKCCSDFMDIDAHINYNGTEYSTDTNNIYVYVVKSHFRHEGGVPEFDKYYMPVGGNWPYEDYSSWTCDDYYIKWGNNGYRLDIKTS